MTKGPLLMNRISKLAGVAAVVAIAGCADLQADDESTTAEELSVLNWTADVANATGDTMSEPAIASIEDFVLEVYPGHSLESPRYLRWNESFNGNIWTNDRQMSPNASSTARPTLVNFNNFIYMFYASGVDQYMARFNPRLQFNQWTGSTRLPFTSLDAVAAVPYNGSLAILRVDPSNHQLIMRTMSTAEVFSAEQPVVYNTAAADPCQQIIIIIQGPTAPSAPVSSPSTVITIGFYVNEVTSSTPALAVSGGCLYMAHRDGTTNTLVYNTFKNGVWGPQRKITSGPGGAAQASAAQPAMAIFNNTLHLVHIGPASTYGDIFWSTYSSAGWSAPLTIPGHQAQGTPSLSVQFNKLFMVHQGYYSGDSIIWHSSYVP